MNITRRILTHLVILTFFAASSVIAQVDRTKKPSAGPAPKAAFPAYHESTLKNGLKVFVVQDSEQPLVTFRLLIKSGSEYDGKEKSGLASIATDLLTKGTTSRNALAFAKESADTLAPHAIRSQLNIPPHNARKVSLSGSTRESGFFKCTT